MHRNPAQRDPFLGRERELRVLDELADTARAGEGRAVLVTGPAGIGKTELVGRWAARLREDPGLRVLVARGSEAERTVPFGVVRRLFERVAAEAAPGLDGAARLGADLVASDRRHAQPAGDPDAARQGLYWLTASLAQDRPLVLVVDDLHWADAQSQRFLDLLRVRLDGLPVLVLAATRERLQGTPVAGWEQDLAVRTLSLAPLQVEDVRGLVEHRLGAVPADLAAACRRATGGNPFLLRELIASLEQRQEGAATAPEDVERVTPESIVRITDARLAGRGVAHRDVAAAVAVLGNAVDLAVLAAVTGRSAVEVGRLADDLTADGLLAPGRPLRFVHPLTLAAVRELLGDAERSDLERRCAAMLAETPGGLDAACAHLLRADPAGEAWVVALLRRGAAEASERGAPETAVRYLERALAEPVASSDRGAVLTELAAAGFAAQDPGVLDAARLAVEHAGDPVQRLRATLVAGHVRTLLGEVPAAIAEVRAVLADPQTAGALPDDLVAEAQGLILMWSVFTAETRRPVLETVTAFPGPDEDVPRELLVLCAFERASACGTAAETVALAERAWGDGALLRERGAGQPFVHYVAIAVVTAGAFDLAERWTNEISAMAAERGLATGTAVAAATRANARVVQGDLLGAEANALEALERSRSSGALDLIMPFIVAPLVRARLAIDGPDAALAVLDAELPASIRGLEILTRPRWLEARAAVALAAGRYADALADTEECRAWEEDWPAPAGGWTDWRSPAVRALLGTGQPERAAAVAAEAVERAERFGALPLLGSALHARALTLEGDARRPALEEAARVLEESGDTLRQVACLTDLGTEIARTDRAAGRVPLEQALALAAGMGAEALAEHARAVLIRSGARPRRRALAGAAALTPAERRVAELAAAQRSNREIAEQLFVTEKTVENHLTTTYRKLGIASRARRTASSVSPPGPSSPRRWRSPGPRDHPRPGRRAPSGG